MTNLLAASLTADIYVEVPKEHIIGAIVATDKFVAEGGQFDWFNWDACPGFLYTGDMKSSNDLGWKISSFFCFTMNAASPFNANWHEDWPLIRKTTIQRYSLEI